MIDQASLALGLFALVAELRRRYPSIDGWRVYVLALILGECISLSIAQSQAQLTSWGMWSMRGLGMALGACGLGSVAKYHAEKSKGPCPTP